MVKLRKVSKRKKILLVSYLIIFMIIISSFKTTNVKADDYTVYMYNYAITVDYDYANLHESTANYNNEYRNFFFSGTEFPYDNSANNFIGLTGSDSYNYILTQAFLDNLDDDRAFKGVEHLYNYTDVSISDYDLVNGSYNEFETNHSIGLLPNRDISVEWSASNYDDSNDIDLHYTLIDEYITDSTDSWIEATNNDDSAIDIFELENKIFTHNPYMIKIWLYASDTSGYASDDLTIGLNYTGSWNERVLPLIGSSLAWYSLDFNIDSITQLELNNTALRVIAPSSITSSSFPVVISTIYAKVYCNGSYLKENLENNDSEYSIIKNTPNMYQINNFSNNCFNMVNGNNIENGSLETFDNSYTSFNSSKGFLTEYYNGTFSFNNQDVGTSGSDIDFVDSYSGSGSSYAKIADNLDNHQNILELYHDGINDPIATNDFESTQSTGTLEFWWGTSDNTKATQRTRLFGGGTVGIELLISGNNFKYDDGSLQDTGITPTNDILYHHKIVFDCGTDTFDWYINEVLEINDGSFKNDVSDIGSIQLRLATNEVHNGYWDAFGYSWDSDYDIGNNLLPYNQNGIIDFTKTHQFNTIGFNPLDTLLKIDLNYAHKVNMTIDKFNFTIWNFDNNSWDLINNTITTNFNELSFVLNSSYYNSTNHIILNWKGNSIQQTFELYLDLLTIVLTYSNYTLGNLAYNEIDIIIESNVLDIDSNTYELAFELIYNTNVSLIVELYIYDFTLSSWISLDNSSISSEKTFTYSNDTLSNILSITNTTKFRFHIYQNFTQELNFELILDYFEIETRKSVQEYDTYHSINCEYYLYTSGSALRGLIGFEFKVYKGYVFYDTYTKVYNGGWLGMSNIESYEINETSIDIETIELVFHARYGDGLDGNTKLNVLFDIIINYDITLVSKELREFELNGYWSDISEIGFNALDYHKRDDVYDNGWNGYYLDDSGYMKGFSCLRGIRVLRTETIQEYNRFFEIPYFNDDIDLSVVNYGGSGGSGSSGEPSYPSGTYWTYETFRVSDYRIVDIVVENWTVEFQEVRAESYEAKYFYQTKSIKESDLGSWRLSFEIIEDEKITLSFNWLRDGVCSIINTILFFIQYVCYLLVSSFSYILMYIGCNILVYLWNYPVKWIFSGLIWVLWYFYLAIFWVLMTIWEGLVWVYENLLLPFLEWLMYDFLPLAIDVFIMVWAFLITLLIYCITLGQIDFDETYNTVYDMLRTAADFMLENTIIVLNNLPALFIAISLYLLLIGLTYIKYIYAKARGYKNRAEALYDSLMTYLIPITITYQIIRKIYDALPDSIA